MINTIFYFPESLTFDQYLDALNSNTDDGIASRTIVFAKQQGKIYNNGKIYGTTYSDVQNLIEQNRYNDEYVREAISNLERDLQENSDAIDLQGQQYLAINQRLSKIETNGYVSEAQMLSAIAGELDGSTQKSSVRNKVNNVAKEASAALFTEVSDQNDNITAQSIVNAITSNSTAKANLASSFNSGDNTMWANVVTQTDLNSATSALYAALQNKANDSEVVKKASIITSINSSGESNVSIDADKINLNGDVIAARLIAAGASIGGFTIAESKLSNAAVEFNGDGSGFLGRGGISWDKDGKITFNFSGSHNSKLTIDENPYGDGGYQLKTSTEYSGGNSSATMYPGYVEASRYVTGQDRVTTSVKYNEVFISDTGRYASLKGGLLNLYTSDSQTNITNTGITTGGSVTANSLVKSGGTSDQFLKADGSVATLKTINGNSLEGTGDIVISGGGSGNYLPLTGGQLTGDLTLYNSDAQIVNVAGKTSDTTSLGGGSITIETATTGTPIKAKSYLDHDQLYFSNQDVKGTSITYNSVTSDSFIKSGGTSAQFLKADGSVDSNTYLPLTGGTITGSITVNEGIDTLSLNAHTISASSIYIAGSGVATRDDLGDYMPLTGGTLTGDLTVSGHVVATAYPVNIKHLYLVSGWQIQMVDRNDDNSTKMGFDSNNVLYLNKGMKFGGSVEATSFVKSGGTSNEVLMADGSTMTLAQLKAALDAI